MSGKSLLVTRATHLLAFTGVVAFTCAMLFAQAATQPEQRAKDADTPAPKATDKPEGRVVGEQDRATTQPAQPQQPSEARPGQQATQPDAALRRSATESADRDRQADQPRRAEADEPQRQPRDRQADQQPADRAERQSTDQRRDDQPRDETRRQPGGQRAARPSVGIEFDAQEERGLSIANIGPNSVAAQAGLRAGDRIVSVDGRQFANPRQFEAYLSGQFGRRIPLIFERGGRQYTAQLAVQQPQGDVAWLGVLLQDSPSNQSGARVSQVYPAGPAARAGVRAGDVIVRVEGQEITGAPDLISTIEEMEPGSRAELLVMRGNQEVKLNAMLGSRDSFIFRGQGEDRFASSRESGEDDEFSNIPPYAMQLEHDRRMAEQHQRIEEELRKLQEEVRKLREAIQPRNQ